MIGLSLWQSIVITAAITTIVVFAVGVVVGHLITQCFINHRKSHHAPSCQKTTNDGCTLFSMNSPAEKYNVEENAAYGKVDFEQ